MTTTPSEQEPYTRDRELAQQAMFGLRLPDGGSLLLAPLSCELERRFAQALATARAEGVEQSAAYVEAHDAIFANKHYAKVMAAAIRGTLLPTRRAEEESGRG